MIAILLIALFFYLGAEAGRSWPWSTWQDNKLKQKLPEIALALLFAGFSSVIYQNIGMTDIWRAILFLPSAAISFAGIESSTWSFLKWTDHTPNPTRSFTLKPVVDWVAWKIGKWTIGSEGYSWTAATVKGSIICLPFALILAPVGGLFFALGYEVGSHFKGRVTKFNPHIMSEGLSFAFVGAFAIFILTLI